MAALDPGPPILAMACEGSIRPGAVKSETDISTTDKQAGGTVEGQPRCYFRGSGKTWCGRGASTSSSQVNVHTLKFFWGGGVGGDSEISLSVCL